MFIGEGSVEGAVVPCGEVVEPALEPVPLVLGGVVLVVLGDVVVLGVVLGEVVVGAFDGDGVVVEFGVPADEFAPPVVPVDPLVCAYTTVAASASTTLVPTAMDLS